MSDIETVRLAGNAIRERVANLPDYWHMEARAVLNAVGYDELLVRADTAEAERDALRALLLRAVTAFGMCAPGSPRARIATEARAFLVDHSPPKETG